MDKGQCATIIDTPGGEIVTSLKYMANLHRFLHENIVSRLKYGFNVRKAPSLLVNIHTYTKEIAVNAYFKLEMPLTIRP